MIKITHFINPHKFFFKRIEDGGFDKQLDEMEIKLKNTVNKKMQSPNEQEEIQTGDTVAVFCDDFNKWIRGIIKAKDEKGLVYVWAVDYGVPLISSSTQVYKLPQIYKNMNVRYQRIHLGGLINCVPAEPSYDLEKDSNVLHEQSNWSPKAIQIAQSVVGRGMHLKFDQVENVQLPNGSHLFGHLKVQKADGSWSDLTNSLSNALVAKVTNDTWATHVHRLDTINQKEWITMNGLPLQAVTAVVPTTVEKFVHDAKLQKKCQPNRNEPRIKENQQVAVAIATGQPHLNQPNEQNANIENHQLDLAAGNTRHFRRYSFNAAQGFNGNGRGGGGGQNFHRNGRFNNRANNFRPRNEDNNAQFPKGWNANGLLANPKYREEIEFFESAFVPPVASPNVSSSENGVGGSNELKAHENRSAETETNGNGAKAENPTKIKPSNDSTPKKDNVDIKPNANTNGYGDGGGGGGNGTI